MLVATAARRSPPPVAPTREEVERPPPRADPSRDRAAADRRGRRRTRALRARPARISDIRFTLSDVVVRRSARPAGRAAAPGFRALCRAGDPVAIDLRDTRPRRDHAARRRLYRRGRGARAADRRRQSSASTVLMAKLVGLRVRGDAGRAERTIAGYLNRLTEQRGVQPLRRRALSAAGRRPARLQRPAGAALGRRRARRGDRRGHRRRTPAWSTSTSRISARASSAAGAALLRGQIFGLTGLGDRTTLASTAPRTRRAADHPARPRFPDRQRGLAIGGQLTYAWASPDLGLPGVDIDRARCSPRWRRATPSSGARRARCAARSASISSTRTSTSTPSRSTATACASPSPG
jgi:hypothetical protein